MVPLVCRYLSVVARPVWSLPILQIWMLWHRKVLWDLSAPYHPGWNLEAHYLALGVANFICTLSPQRIIIGGGVIEQPQLLPLVREKVQGLLNGYAQAPQILEEIDDYIVPPGLGKQSGVLGAIALVYQPAGEAVFDIYLTKTHRMPLNKHVRSRSVTIYYQMKVPNTRLE